MGKIDSLYNEICLRAWLGLKRPTVICLLALLVLVALAAPLWAQASGLENQVGTSLQPLANLFTGVAAKLLAIILIVFGAALIGFRGEWTWGLSALIAGIVLGIVSQIVTAIFAGSGTVTLP